MLLTEHMTLTEKLAAIDEAMQTAEIKQQENPDVPVDPMESLMCLGCQ